MLFTLKIIHIVPGFEEGGVERYVLELCREQISSGHEVTLASCGGRLEKFLPSSVRLIHIPVHRKNLFTGLYCAKRIISSGKWDILHAHSRVPAFVSWAVSSRTKTPWIMTAHAQYSLNLGIIPLKHADGVICVSDSVRKHLESYLPPLNATIPNGITEPSAKWEGKYFPENKKFLYVGRLTHLKGLDVALKALEPLKSYEWTLDVLGDGSQRSELEALVKDLGLSERVKFYGFRDDAENFMSRSACLIFPSYQEGFPLTVNEALSVGVPVLASDIEALRPLSSGELIQPGDVPAWTEAIRRVIDGGKASPLSAEKLTKFSETASKTEEFYRRVISGESASLC